jgi:segregation and condensation protein A
MAPRVTPERRHEPSQIAALGVVMPPPIQVQTPTFDGSLGMLFQCVRDHKVDLMDVPLAPICEAYFMYLISSPNVELDEAAAALIALAYLLERKAWLLLPVVEPEPEMEEPLELPSPSIRQYDAAIEALNIWQEERSKTFFRSFESGPDPYEVPYTLANVSASDLAMAFERVLRRARPDGLETLNAPRKSLAEQMKIVLKSLATKWLSLNSLVPEDITRTDAVYWFLAILELVRLGQASVRLHDKDVEFARAA